MSSIYFYALFIIARVFPTFIGLKVNVFLDKPPRQSNQDTCLSNPFPMGNSRKYPYHTMDCFHILNFPAFGISKMGYQPSPQNFVIINLSISGLAVTPNPTRFKKLKWHPRWKKNMFCIEWTNNSWATAVFTREKKGCFVALWPLELDVQPYILFVFFCKWTQTHAWLIDPCHILLPQ